MKRFINKNRYHLIGIFFGIGMITQGLYLMQSTNIGIKMVAFVLTSIWASIVTLYICDLIEKNIWGVLYVRKNKMVERYMGWGW